MKLVRIILFVSLTAPLCGMDEYDQKWPELVDQISQKINDNNSGLKDRFIKSLSETTPSKLLDTTLTKVLGTDGKERVKWQRTLLTPEKYSWGLYKGDLIEVVKTVTDIFADTMMRNALVKKRINLIFDSLIKDNKEICHIIEVIEQGRKKWDQEYFDKSLWQKLGVNVFERTAQAYPLVNYTTEHHKLFGTLPLTRGTIVPLFAHWLFKSVSDLVYSRYVSDSWLEFGVSGFLSYKPTNEGVPKLTKVRPSPIVSRAMRLLRFLYDPSKYTGKIALATLNRTNKFLETFSPITLPASLQGQTAESAYDFLGICIGAKIYDKFYTKQWTVYAVKHRVVLHELLLQYEKALSSGGDLQEAERSIRSFIERGHRDKGKLPGSMLINWYQSSREGQTSLAEYVQYGLIAGILAKLAWSYYANQQ